MLIDKAMDAIEKENPRLKGVLGSDFGREDLDKRRLGELVDLIGTIGLGEAASRSRDVLGRVYEYFLGQFANAKGRDPVGTDAETAALFPDRFVDSGLGSVPAGWEMTTLGAISERPQDDSVGPQFLRIADINKQLWVNWDAVP